MPSNPVGRTAEPGGDRVYVVRIAPEWDGKDSMVTLYSSGSSCSSGYIIAHGALGTQGRFCRSQRRAGAHMCMGILYVTPTGAPAPAETVIVRVFVPQPRTPTVPAGASPSHRVAKVHNGCSARRSWSLSSRVPYGASVRFTTETLHGILSGCWVSTATESPSVHGDADSLAQQ